MKEKQEKTITDHLKSVVFDENKVIPRPEFPADRHEASIVRVAKKFTGEEVDAMLTDVLTQVLEGKIQLTNEGAIQAFVKNYKK